MVLAKYSPTLSEIIYMNKNCNKAEIASIEVSLQVSGTKLQQAETNLQQHSELNESIKEFHYNVIAMGSQEDLKVLLEDAEEFGPLVTTAKSPVDFDVIKEHGWLHTKYNCLCMDYDEFLWYKDIYQSECPWYKDL